MKVKITKWTKNKLVVVILWTVLVSDVCCLVPDLKQLCED